MREEDLKKFRLENHCFGCSADYRSVLRKSPNPEIKQWFMGLRVKDPDQYRQLSLNYQAHMHTHTHADVTLVRYCRIALWVTG